ncbi:hypothetical protein BHM03_00055180 [Ensete ventricosum]|nr:hypothetical protein BHM03_00055180 [Ensete ventricosum]
MAQGSSLKEDRDSSEDYRGSLGDSPKESGSSLGTQREIAEKKTGGLAARSLEVVGLCGKVRVLIELDLKGIQINSMRQPDPLLGLVELNQLTKELVNVKVKPKFEKWREPLFWKFRRVNRQ